MDGRKILALTPFLVAAVGLTLYASSAPAQGPSATRWEYHCTLPPGAMKKPAAATDKASHPATKVLNHLGSQGWELVTVDPNNGHYCFKRQTR